MSMFSVYATLHGLSCIPSILQHTHLPIFEDLVFHQILLCHIGLFHKIYKIASFQDFVFSIFCLLQSGLSKILLCVMQCGYYGY